MDNNIVTIDRIKRITPTCISTACESKSFPYCMEGCIAVANVVELKED